MFEFLLSESQLFNTVEKHNSNSDNDLISGANFLKTIFKECRFVIICENANVFLDKISIFGEHYKLWAGSHVCLVKNINNLYCNPFRIELSVEFNSLFDIDFNSLLFEKTYFIKKDKSINDLKFPKLFENIENEILIFDPYFIANIEISIYCLNQLLNRIGISQISNVIIITCPEGHNKFITDRELIKFSEQINKTELDINNVCLLSIKKDIYHDRELIGKTIHIALGGSFDFLSKSGDIFTNNKTMKLVLNTLLNSSRFSSVLQILDILFEACKYKYLGNQLKTEGEKIAAKGFDDSSLYKYWNYYNN